MTNICLNKASRVADYVVCRLLPFNTEVKIFYRVCDSDTQKAINYAFSFTMVRSPLDAGHRKI